MMGMDRETISREICRLLHYGRQRGLLEEEDLPYTANRMLD